MMGEASELDSPVSRFYRGKTVFITGATGFMGKVVALNFYPNQIFKVKLFYKSYSRQMSESTS